MHSLIIGLCVGAGAAILDIAPRLIRRMDARSIVSAVVQWLVVGLAIAFLRTGLPSWATGLAAGLLFALPIAILISATEPKSVPIVLATSVFLGTLCGAAVGFVGAA
jgi:hypothetical protein